MQPSFEHYKHELIASLDQIETIQIVEGMGISTESILYTETVPDFILNGLEIVHIEDIYGKNRSVIKRVLEIVS